MAGDINAICLRVKTKVSMMFVGITNEDTRFGARLQFMGGIRA